MPRMSKRRKRELSFFLTESGRIAHNKLYKLWSLRQPMIEARIAELREEIRQDEEDIDELLMLKIQRGR